ncbi:lactonase family protein [Paraburkholderia phosphatilytica]|uniref:lactonase family protein n=1 Tax=Paraburkholderia phosphatilytica TaxID=2282883 RepID=UPI000E51E088|nr:beta-propeller fold lactonase family protein [Paraburkholderia phosphatilytica]
MTKWTAALAATLGGLTGTAYASTAVYVSNADSQSISVLRLNEATGKLSSVQDVPVSGMVMPLAVSPDRRYLFASLRSKPYSVASFRVGAGDGMLTPVATSPLPESMANLSTDRTGRFLFAASYGGNLISESRIGEEGVVAPASIVIPTKPKAHAIKTDPSNRWLFATNLGGDIIMQCRFDAKTGAITPNDPPTLNFANQAGPRHFTFHPNGRVVYIVDELDGKLERAAFDPDRGTLAIRQTVSAVPAGFTGTPWAADVHTTPDGHYLYASERTSSTLIAYRIDAQDGNLTKIGEYPTEKQPRAFAIDPSGHWLLSAGQLSNAVSVHRIDPATGELKLQGSFLVGKNPSWVEIVDVK